MPMEIYSDFSEFSSETEHLCLAIGMFDGVHKGHKTVLNACRKHAQRLGAKAAVLTFWPHPSRLFNPENPTQMLQSIDSKKLLLEKEGIQILFEIPFTQELASIEAKDFLPYLVENLPNLKAVFVGENFRFGNKRFGDVDLLREQSSIFGIQTMGMDRELYHDEPISSSRIRDSLAAGKIQEVNDMLGRYYACSGFTVKGKQLGRSIGFPTLNIPYSPERRPALGVYAVRVFDKEGKTFNAIANYGLRPTVNDQDFPLLEIHLLQKKSPWTYGHSLHIEWLHFIRPEKKFASLQELKDQIKADIQICNEFFTRL